MAETLDQQFERTVAGIKDGEIKSALEKKFANSEKVEKLQLLILAQQAKSTNNKWWSLITGGMVVVAFVFLLYVIDKTFLRMTVEQMMLTSAARPIILISLIFAMLGFGGLLIARPLFSTDPTDVLTERFRMSREIFLVFSGVFATVIGFYFGSLDKPAKESVSAIDVKQQGVGRDGQIEAIISGGTAPYIVKLRVSKGDPIPLTADDKNVGKFTLPRIGNEALECPAGLALLVADKSGQVNNNITITLTREALLAAGWKNCTSGTQPVTPPPAPTGGATNGSVPAR